jgi:hypothetical protein
METDGSMEEDGMSEKGEEGVGTPENDVYKERVALGEEKGDALVSTTEFVVVEVALACAEALAVRLPFIVGV